MVGAIVCCGCCGYCCCLNILCDARTNVGDDGNTFSSDSSYEDKWSSSLERIVTKRVKQYWS